MNFFGGEQKQQQQGPDPVVAATIEMQMYTGASQLLVVRESGSCITYHHGALSNNRNLKL
jgi:hypothetical protein